MSIESYTPDSARQARDTESAATQPSLSTPRLTDQSLREIFSAPARRQRYLDVEAALALAQADLGVIPRSAGDKIAAAARLERLDGNRMAAEQAATGHSMMPLVSELPRAVGEPEGGWVHWGATTQNIQQTGDVVGIRSAVHLLMNQFCDVLEALADQVERTADTLMADRTHWAMPTRQPARSRKVRTPFQRTSSRTVTWSPSARFSAFRTLALMGTM